MTELSSANHAKVTRARRWSAPEVGVVEGTMRIRNSKEDVWGFGLLLYELMTRGTNRCFAFSHQHNFVHTQPICRTTFAHG